MNYLGEFSNNLGILNSEQERFSNVQSAHRQRPVAYCDSKSCVGSINGYKKIYKNVKMNADYCPDCGSALIWVSK